MKVERDGFRMLRRDQLLQELVHDSYKSRRKLPEPSACPKCGAIYQAGRWTWGSVPKGAHHHVCPACSRIQDEYPAGYVNLAGDFLREHRDEIVNLIRHCEAREKAEHPMERIMAIEDTAEGLLVTTTDSHLARDIAERLHDAYKGTLDFRYNREDNLLRASWRR
jgi:NMD protein affecting ribosome stability and mRNA decay